MLLSEHDAKELLAVQGIPVPGGIQLEQAPRYDEDQPSEKSGPWTVRPQLLGAVPNLSTHVVTATNNAEIYAAATALLGATIDGRRVHSVFVERKFTPRGQSFLRFECDPPNAGIRITVGDPAPDGQSGGPPDAKRPSTVVPPDPNSVIAGVEKLATAMPSDVRDCVAEAGRMLAPLFFGYEAVLMEIAPLLLSDGGWTVGDVKLAIDENALFRHPELLSLVERRDYAYRDVRERRRFGVDYRVIDPDGTVATLATGAAYGAFLIDEMKARGLSPYNVMGGGLATLNSSDEPLDHLLESYEAAASPRCLMVAVVGDVVDLPEFAHRFAAALTKRPDFKLPIVARLVGAGAGSAGAILEQAAPAIQVEPALDAALDLTFAHVAGRAG